MANMPFDGKRDEVMVSDDGIYTRQERRAGEGNFQPEMSVPVVSMGFTVGIVQDGSDGEVWFEFEVIAPVVGHTTLVPMRVPLSMLYSLKEMVDDTLATAEKYRKEAEGDTIGDG